MVYLLTVVHKINTDFRAIQLCKKSLVKKTATQNHGQNHRASIVQHLGDCKRSAISQSPPYKLFAAFIHF